MQVPTRRRRVPPVPSTVAFPYRILTAAPPGTYAAFTLIELLVVIAIVSILAAILFPVFVQARAKARQASCLSNLKQLAAATRMYMDDHDGLLFEPAVPLVAASAASVPGYTWRETVYPYVRNHAAFECPGASPEGGDPRFENRASATLGMNSYLGSDHEYEKEPVPLTISPQCAGCATGDIMRQLPRPLGDPALPLPAKTVLFADGFEKAWRGREPRGFWIDPAYGKGRRGGLAARHDGGVSVAFVDGHVRWYPASALLNQRAVDDSSFLVYMEAANYNAAGVIWNADGPNPEVHPGKYPSFCCRE